MSARLSLGRTLAVAGIATAVAVPLSAGSAYAASQPHHKPVPAASASHQPPAKGHSAGHHMPVPGHSTAHHLPVPGHSAGHHPKPASHHSRVTELRTRIRNAQVRMSPTIQRHGRALSVLQAPGSRVAVTCWTLGARENGSNTWYRTVAPARGYISSTEVARPAHPVGRCK